MEILFEVVFQFLGELLLQVVAQLILELGFHSLAAPFRPARNPIWPIIGFTLWGAAIGALSLWPFPRSFIHDSTFREINLFVTPVVVGIVMWVVGRIRLKKGQDLNRLDRFGYAFTFAFAMAFIRYNWAA